MTRAAYDIGTAIDELHDVRALFAALTSMYEAGSNESRVIDVAMERVHRVIDGLDLLELQQNIDRIGEDEQRG
jgi:hypothetical protein